MLKDGERGARHLSGNVYTHRYNEGPAEKLDAWCMDYKSVQENGGDKALKGWISTNAKEKNSKLGQIFNHAETRNYLTAVLEFRPHFNVDDIFSVNFCVDKLHNVNGAVRSTKGFKYDVKADRSTGAGKDSRTRSQDRSRTLHKQRL